MVHHDRKRQIEDAAGRLFTERGFAGTSMRDIARALHLQGGSLYAHISSKQDVLWTLVEEAGTRFLGGVEPIAQGPGPVVGRLRSMVRAHVGIVLDPTLHAAVFLNEWKYLSEERRRDVFAMRDRYQALFESVVDEGIADGAFSSSDPKASVRYLLSALNGVAAWYRPGGPLGPAEIADTCTDLFLTGLRSGPVETAGALEAGGVLAHEGTHGGSRHDAV